jgi:GNAT superfamily N-acetyltransferase
MTELHDGNASGGLRGEAVGVAGECTVREARAEDVAAMLRFIRELALYEREPNAVVATEADLLRDGFGIGVAEGISWAPKFRALIVEWQCEVAGFALYFTSYSTWLGRHGLRLEDIYVTPALRGRGLGKALLARLAAIAVAESCPRLEWDVLVWNQPAIDVYEAVGAKTQTEWRIMRLSGGALERLAATALSR